MKFFLWDNLFRYTWKNAQNDEVQKLIILDLCDHWTNDSHIGTIEELFERGGAKEVISQDLDLQVWYNKIQK